MNVKKYALGLMMTVAVNGLMADAALIAKGEALAVTCSACHGAKGISNVSNWPSLGGQHAGYLLKQMQDFKRSEPDTPDGRYDPSMKPLMVALSDEELTALAAYFAHQPIPTGKADQNMVKRGETIYRGGDMEKKITACIACHGAGGLGLENAGYPVLSGQQAEYVELTLKAYRDEKRRNDPNAIMRDIAKRMSDADIKAVASYIAGLHPVEEAA